jgi:hypothetical protein
MKDSTFYHDVVIATVQPNCRANFLLCESGSADGKPSFATYPVVSLLQVNRRVFLDFSGTIHQPPDGKCFTLHAGPMPEIPGEERPPKLEDVHDMTVCMVVSNEDGEVVLVPSSGYEMGTLSATDVAFGRLVLCPWPETEDDARLDEIKRALAEHVKGRSAAQKKQAAEKKKPG